MIDKARVLFWSSRPISWINTAYPFAAGYLIAMRHVDATLIIGSLYFLVAYNLLMYGINDVFDYESDLRNPRKGGIEGALLDRSLHRLTILAAIISNLPFLVYLLAVGNTASNLWLTFLVFMVIAYSAPKLRFKERPFLDSFTSSVHFFGPLVFALLLAGFEQSYMPYIISFALWGMASHAFGAVQDITSDRAAKISSIATVIGAKRTVQLAAILYFISAVILFYQNIPSLVVGAAVLLYVCNVLPYAGLTDEHSELANTGWKRFIWLNLFTGFVVTMALIYSVIEP